MTNNALFERFARDFVGVASPAQQGRRVYFDAAATSLMPRVCLEALGTYYANACSNPHTNAHLGGRASTLAVEESRLALASLLTADPRTHAVLFLGSGSTAALNRVAKAMFPQGSRSKRDLVICTGLEHHANMLPWTAHAGKKNVLYAKHTADGGLDMRSLKNLLTRNGPRVRVVSCTWASNVTGAVSPIGEIAKLAHRQGAQIVVDAAQAAPHLPVGMFPDGEPLDALVLSGHKLFAPGSPGVLVARRDLFEKQVVGDVGGGGVKSVTLDNVLWQDRAEEREESGTPNVPGIISLGVIALLLQQIGMQTLYAHDQALTSYLLERLRRVPKMHVYGSDAPGGLPRVGTISFNLQHIPHGLVATVLSDYYNIAVRNACFCAQPFVREMLAEAKPCANSCGGGPEQRPGMIRASLGPWNTTADCDLLVEALAWISGNAKDLCKQYQPGPDGSWWSAQQVHPASAFSVSGAVQRYMRGR